MNLKYLKWHDQIYNKSNASETVNCSDKFKSGFSSTEFCQRLASQKIEYTLTYLKVELALPMQMDRDTSNHITTDHLFTTDIKCYYIGFTKARERLRNYINIFIIYNNISEDNYVCTIIQNWI